MVDLSLLANAMALVEHGSFARAAEALHVSQPALSRQIASLETALGAPLFDRTHKKVEPTAFGRLVLERGQALIADAAELKREIALLRNLDIGELHVGAGVYPAELSVGTAAGRLASRHPGLRLQVTTGDWASMIEAALSSKIDFAVVETSVIEDHERLAVEPLPHHPGVFFCRSGHPILSEKEIGISRIFEYPFAGPKMPARAVERLAQALKRDHLEPNTGWFVPAIKVDTIALARTAIASSDAIGMAPVAAISADLAAGRLAALPLRPAWLHTNYGFVFLRNRTLSPAAQAFMAELRAVEAELVTEEEGMLAQELNCALPAASGSGPLKP